MAGTHVGCFSAQDDDPNQSVYVLLVDSEHKMFTSYQNGSQLCLKVLQTNISSHSQNFHRFSLGYVNPLGYVNDYTIWCFIHHIKVIMILGGWKEVIKRTWRLENPACMIHLMFNYLMMYEIL